MFPQPKGKFGQALIGLIVAIWVWNNPAQAAEFVNQTIDAISTFAAGLG